MARTTHWRPKAAAHSASSSGLRTAAVFTPTLSAPARRTALISLGERTPPPTVSGTDTSAAVRCTTSRRVERPSGDVEIADLVGALSRVADGQLHRISLVDELGEPDAFDDPFTGHVEARDHSFTQHGIRRRNWREVGGRQVHSAPDGIGHRPDSLPAPSPPTPIRR